MGSHSGPKIFSSASPNPSWAIDPYAWKNTDVFSSNFFINGNFSSGTGMPQESGSNATNTVIEFSNPGSTPFVLQQTAGIPQTEYQINLTTELVSSTVYCMSGWYAESADYSCADGGRMFHARTFSSSGAHIATGTGIGTTLRTVVINGITWRYCYELISTPSDYSNSFNWYVGYGNSNYTGKRYYTSLKMERGSFPSIRNIFNNTAHAYSLNGTSFDSQGGVILDGTNDYIRIPFNSAFNITSNPFSVIAWMKKNDSSNGYNGVITADSTGDNTWKIFKDTGEAFYRARVGNTSLPFTGGYTVGRWHQYAFTRSGSGGSTTIKAYRDGLEVNTVTGTITDPISFSNDLAIGSYRLNDAVSGLYLMNQTIGPIYFFNSALTAQDILDNFQAIRSRYGV